MLGFSNQRFQPAIVETARVISVNVANWTVDCISEHGGKRYLDIQVSSPYLHYMNGECVSIMPEVGALCWVCTPSEGDDAQEFILGFQAPMDGPEDFSAGRPDLNPGDIMMRTRDENFIILRRGGVVQIGATPTAQRMYVPIRNFIRDFCENYELLTFGGSMQWLVGTDRTENPNGDDVTKFQLLVKEKANDPSHVIDLAIGSHGEDDTTTLSLVAWADGSGSSDMMVQLEITKEGDVSWVVEKDWSVEVKGNHHTHVTGDLGLEVDGKIEQTSSGDSLYKANGKMTVSGASKTKVKGGSQVDIEAPKINIGGSEAAQSVVLGEALNGFLSSLMGYLDGLQCPTAPLVTGSTLPVIPTAGGISGAFSGLLQAHLSKTVKVKA